MGVSLKGVIRGSACLGVHGSGERRIPRRASKGLRVTSRDGEMPGWRACGPLRGVGGGANEPILEIPGKVTVVVQQQEESHEQGRGEASRKAG